MQQPVQTTDKVVALLMMPQLLPTNFQSPEPQLAGNQLYAWIEMLRELQAACQQKNRWPRSIFADGHATCVRLVEATQYFFPRTRVQFTPHNNLAIQWQPNAAQRAHDALMHISRNMDVHSENYALVLSYRWLPGLLSPAHRTPTVCSWHNFLVANGSAAHIPTNELIP